MVTKEEAKKNLKRIIEKYNRFKNSGELEIEANAEKIIEDIFEDVLGWEALEDYVKRKSQKNRKYPDYTFGLNSINRFFLEAKKVSADLDDVSFQKQAIGYARSSAVSFAVLTNFVEIRVYVVDREIDKSEKFGKFQLFQPILIENCTNEKEFEKLWLLSKESFVTRKIYDFAEETCKLPKRKKIDTQLSEKLNFLREKIKSNIKKNEKPNRSILSDENVKILLDEVAQKILDRLVFIRVCEDREYENRYLESFLNTYKENKNTNLWESAKELFRDYYEKNEKTGVGGYDSELFKKSLCDDIFVDDDLLELIIEELYYFEDGTPVDFSKIPADVLGNLYENYLKYISKNVETQKSHRKEQGIYYTPNYIVDYIIKHTLGELLKNKKVNVKKIRVLDPACGSGSFLIKAFDVLNEYYARHDKDYTQTEMDFQTGIPFTTKVKILENNIFGVDLDKQAVEITQLNLLLRIAEKGNKLPLLQQNIKCGNSLIDDETVTGDEAFNWEDEFPEVFKDGRFDVVIGNPPYVFARGEKFSEQVKKYYYDNFELASYQLNTYLLFINQAYKLLNKDGYLGFIIPNTWLTIDTFVGLRKFLLEETGNLQIINIYDKVFQDANVDTCLLLFKKGEANKVTLGEFREGKLEIIGKFPPAFFKENNCIINISLAKSKDKITVLNKIKKNSEILDNFSTVKAGLKAYEIEKGKPAQTDEMKNKRVYHNREKISDHYIKYLEGRDVRRYEITWGGWWLKYGKCLAAPRTKELFNSPRILVRQIPSPSPYSINAVFTKDYLLNDINSMIIYKFINVNPLFLLAVLNSRITTFWFTNTFDKLQRKTFPQFKVKELAIFPIPKANENEQGTLAKLAQKMLELHKQLQKFGDKLTDERRKIESEIQKTDKKIDKLVYVLYGLNKKEIEIIEKSSRAKV